MSTENPIEVEEKTEVEKYNIDDHITNLNFDVPEAVIKYNLKKYEYNLSEKCEAVRSDIEVLDSNETLIIKLDSTEFMGTHVKGAMFNIYYKVLSNKTENEDAEFVLYKVDVPDKFDMQFVMNDNPSGVLETMIEIIEGKCEEYGKSKFLIDQIRKTGDPDIIDKYFHINKYYGEENRLERLFSCRPDVKELYDDMLKNREARRLKRLERENEIDAPTPTKEKWW